MTEKSLYERLGGVFAIAAVVDHFSDAVVKNPIVGKTSKNPALREWHTKKLDRLPGLKFMRTLWVCAVAGGPFQYTPTRPGKTEVGLEEAHRDLRISPDEFDEVAAELGRTLDFVKVPRREKEEVLAAFAAHKNEVTAGYMSCQLSACGQGRGFADQKDCRRRHRGGRRGRKTHEPWRIHRTTCRHRPTTVDRRLRKKASGHSDGGRSPGGRFPCLHDRQLRGDATVLPGAIFDHHPLYVFQEAGRGGQCRGRHERGRFDPGDVQDEGDVSPSRNRTAPTGNAPAPPSADQPKARTSMQFKTRRPAFADQDLEKRLEDQAVVIKAEDERRPILVQAARRLWSHVAADRRVCLDQSPRRGGGRRRAVRPRSQPRQALQ